MEEGPDRVDAAEERKKLYDGFGETFSRAVEFVATPMIFALIGHFIDTKVGTDKVFMVALATFALIGMFLRFYFAYMEAMKAEEARGPWRKS